MEALPSWCDGKLGSMKRAALWLESEVGEGNVFTKTELRAAFHDVAQIDRRTRELRKYGWQINTSREDPSLKQDEQRYVKRGAEIWIPGQQATSKTQASLTATQRSKVLQEDGFLCRACGISTGESYGDGSADTSQLDVARRQVRGLEGVARIELVTECNRCRTGSTRRKADLNELMARVQTLGPLERGVLMGWMDAGQREFSELEKLWGLFRSLPQESRVSVAEAVRELDS